jgi:hypothetical protein
MSSGICVELLDARLRFDGIPLDLKKFVLVSDASLLKPFTHGPCLQKMRDHLRGRSAHLDLLRG